jgi:hypothetical protein
MSQIETPEHLKIKRFWEENNKLAHACEFYFEEDEMTAQDWIDSVGEEIV